jgi:hypoxanthine-DNA glycosylase
VTIEVHPFENFIPPNATHLVLGTFPTHQKNWRFRSYYPGRSNFFWRMLSEIYHHPFKHKEGEEAAKERVALCAAKGIAISDTIYRCQRKIETSSKDSDLLVLEKMDILAMLKKHPGIHTIILTGSSGGVSAHKLFFEHLTENNIAFRLKVTKPTIHGSFIFEGRKIKTHTLYSTSGLNIGRYSVALQQYTKWLPKR